MVYCGQRVNDKHKLSYSYHLIHHHLVMCNRHITNHAKITHNTRHTHGSIQLHGDFVLLLLLLLLLIYGFRYVCILRTDFMNSPCGIELS